MSLRPATAQDRLAAEIEGYFGKTLWLPSYDT